MRKQLIFCLTFVLVLAIVGTAAAKVKIGLSTQDLENEYWINLADEFRRVAAEHGVDVVVDARYDAIGQQQIVENFLQQGVDAIVVSPVDPVAVQPVFEEAMEQDVIVVNGHFPTQLGSYNIFLDTGPYNSGWIAGAEAARYINEELGGQAEVAVITLPENTTLTIRTDGIIDAIQELAPKAKIVAEQRAHSRQDAVSVTENILAAHPNVKVFAGWSDAVMLGSIAGIEGLGKNPADFCIVGIDATPEALSAIEAGTMYASVDNPAVPFARLAFEVAYELVTNKDSNWHFVQQAITKLGAVNKDNLDQYLK